LGGVRVGLHVRVQGTTTASGVCECYYFVTSLVFLIVDILGVSILASFCVWTKSLVCNDAPQGFYYSEMLQSQKIFSSLSAVRTIEPSSPDDHLSLFHLSG